MAPRCRRRRRQCRAAGATLTARLFIMAEALIKYEEVAIRLGLKRRGVELLVERRQIPVVKLSARCHRFRWSDVEKMVAKVTVSPVV